MIVTTQNDADMKLQKRLYSYLMNVSAVGTVGQRCKMELCI